MNDKKVFELVQFVMFLVLELEFFVWGGMFVLVMLQMINPVFFVVMAFVLVLSGISFSVVEKEMQKKRVRNHDF